MPQKALQYFITIYGNHKSREFSLLDGKIYWDNTVPIKVKSKISFPDNEKIKLIGIAVGSKWNLKKWKYYNELIDIILKNNKNVYIYIIGDNKDNNEFDCKEKERTFCLLGKFSIKELSYFISHLNLVITNDSAILHIAESVGVKVLAIFGPTTKEFGFFPRRKDSEIIDIRLPCKPCTKTGKGKCKKRKQYCMELISPKMVYNIFRKM